MILNNFRIIYYFKCCTINLVFYQNFFLKRKLHDYNEDNVLNLTVDNTVLGELKEKVKVISGSLCCT